MSPASRDLRFAAAEDGVFPCCCLGNGVAVGVNLHQFPARDHLLQASGELLSLVSVQSKFADQLLIAGSLFRLTLEFFQDCRI